jgi:hypothetical protein
VTVIDVESSPGVRLTSMLAACLIPATHAPARMFETRGLHFQRTARGTEEVSEAPAG